MTERTERIVFTIATIILVPPMFILVLMVVGMMIEGIGEHKEMRERCLKQATNGYEIERCR